ncbi:hypothetical protein Fmac_015523 [Flemingia macrophylla]|uniref:Protein DETOXIFICATION n=1 Tax=Flemingia macrophylla TaxID=520843 RepID=A0ABD1MGW4_9FABA
MRALKGILEDFNKDSNHICSSIQSHNDFGAQCQNLAPNVRALVVLAPSGGTSMNMVQRYRRKAHEVYRPTIHEVLLIGYIRYRRKAHEVYRPISHEVIYDEWYHMHVELSGIALHDEDVYVRENLEESSQGDLEGFQEGFQSHQFVNLGAVDLLQKCLPLPRSLLSYFEAHCFGVVNFFFGESGNRSLLVKGRPLGVGFLGSSWTRIRDVQRLRMSLANSYLGNKSRILTLSCSIGVRSSQNIHEIFFAPLSNRGGTRVISSLRSLPLDKQSDETNMWEGCHSTDDEEHSKLVFPLALDFVAWESLRSDDILTLKMKKDYVCWFRRRIGIRVPGIVTSLQALKTVTTKGQDSLKTNVFYGQDLVDVTGETLIGFFQQDPRITNLAYTYFIFSLPELLIHSFLHLFRIYLRVQGVTHPVTLASLLETLIHFLFNYVIVTHLSHRIASVIAASNNSILFFLLLHVSPCCAAPTHDCLSGWKRLLCLASPNYVSVCHE